MRQLLGITIFLFLVSCKQSITQPTVLDKGGGFDLEKIDFNENVTNLYAKHVLNETGVDYDSARDGKITDTTFRYKISNIVTEAMNFSIPQKEFGYLYKSPEMDSIAKFQNLYFNSIYTLTDKAKAPVAYYAQVQVDSPLLRTQFLDSLKKKYGNPKYSFYVSSEFNQCSYEWDLADRTIQVATSFGWGASASSDGTSKSGKYYLLDLLIISNKYKTSIYDAHTLVLPDTIIYEGKKHSYKDFQFEKISTISDEFLLNSTKEEFTKDEYGEHNIERAEKDE